MIEDYFVDVCYVDRVTRPDGMGGVIEQWTDGAPFRAGISMQSSTEAIIAERNGMKTIYVIVTLPIIELKHDDRVKDVKTGQIYRVTSDGKDMTTPAVADVQYRQATAEVIG